MKNDNLAVYQSLQAINSAAVTPEPPSGRQLQFQKESFERVELPGAKQAATHPLFANIDPKKLQPRQREMLDFLTARYRQAQETIALVPASLQQIEAAQESLDAAQLSPQEKLSSRQQLEGLRTSVARFNKEQAATDPEYYLALRTQDLARFVKDYRSGGIVRVDYVHDKIAELKEKMSASPLTIVYGHTGLGKTEIAKIAAKEFSDKEPLIVRCSPDMRPAEFFGRDVLKAGSTKLSEIHDTIESTIKEWQGTNPKATEEQIRNAERRIEQRALHESQMTYSEYVMGLVYLAAEQERVLIIDEANYAPPGQLAKLNDFLTKKRGDRIRVQENGGREIEVKDIRVIMTGNYIEAAAASVGYGNRYPLDPALSDRAAKMELGRIPQELSCRLHEVGPDAPRQLFQVAISALMIEGIENCLLPKGVTLDHIWRLSQLAALTQVAFAGELAASNPLAPRDGGVGVAFTPDGSITNRKLIRMLEQWKSSGFAYELDHYLWDALKDASLRPEQQRLFYQLGQNFGFFNAATQNYQGWPSDVSTSNKMPKYATAQGFDEVPLPELLEAMFGSAPQREIWQDNSEVVATGVGQDMEFLASIEEQLKGHAEWRALRERELGNACPV